MAARNANIKIDLVFDGSGMTKGINQIKSHLKGLQKSAESANKSISSMGSGSKGFNSLLSSANKFNSTMNSNITQQSRNMNSQYSSAASNMESSFQRAGTRVSSIIAGIAAALAALTFGNLLKEGVGDAMMVEASLAAVDKRFGESASGVTKWAQANAQAFGMSEGEAINYLNSVSIMLSKSIQDTEQLAQLSKEYVNMIAVVSTATGYSAEVVYEKVMSGLRGATSAIDDLSIDIKVKSLEASEAFKYLAPPSATWNQLSVELQDQIRILAIVTEAYEIHGNTIGTNVAGQHGALVGALKTTKTALGQAFLPIYVTIIPMLNSMVLWLQKAIVWVGRFIYAIFGQTAAMKALRAQQDKEKKDFMVRSAENVKNMSNQSNTASESIDKLGKKNVDAAKKAKKAGEEYKKASKNVQGFDKINKMASEDKPKALETPEITKTKEDSASSFLPTSLPGSALNDLGLTGNQDLTLGDSFESLLDQMEDVPEEVQEKADKIRKAFEKIEKFLFGDKEDLESVGLIGWIRKFLFGDPNVDESKGLWGAVIRAYEGIHKILFGDKEDPESVGLIGWIREFLFGDPNIDESKGFVGVLKRAYESLQKLIEERGGTILGMLTGFITTFLIITNSGKIATAFSTVITFLGKLKNFATIGSMLTKLGGVFAMLTNPITLIAIGIGLLIGAFVELYTSNEEFRNKMNEVWKSVMETMKIVWEEGIKPILGSIMEMLKNLWENVVKPIWDSIVEFVKIFFILSADISLALKPVVDFY